MHNKFYTKSSLMHIFCNFQTQIFQKISYDDYNVNESLYGHFWIFNFELENLKEIEVLMNFWLVV